MIYSKYIHYSSNPEFKSLPFEIQQLVETSFEFIKKTKEIKDVFGDLITTNMDLFNSDGVTSTGSGFKPNQYYEYCYNLKFSEKQASVYGLIINSNQGWMLFDSKLIEYPQIYGQEDDKYKLVVHNFVMNGRYNYRLLKFNFLSQFLNIINHKISVEHACLRLLAIFGLKTNNQLIIDAMEKSLKITSNKSQK